MRGNSQDTHTKSRPQEQRTLTGFPGVVFLKSWIQTCLLIKGLFRPDCRQDLVCLFRNSQYST